MQKYERSTNRFSAPCLRAISQIWNAPATYFFDDTSKDTMKYGLRCFNSIGEIPGGHDYQLRDPITHV